MFLNCGAGEDSWVPWTARRSNQLILKEISPKYSLEGLMLKLKGHLMHWADSLEKIDAGKDWGQEEKEVTEDEMVGWHHWLSGHEFQQTLGGGEGQEMLAWCCPWGCKELDITERLTTTDTCIHMAESFYRSPEMITTLLLGYKFSSVTQSCPILWVL